MKSLVDSGKKASCCAISFLCPPPARLNSHPQSVLLKESVCQKKSPITEACTPPIILHCTHYLTSKDQRGIILLITPTGAEMKGLNAEGLTICPSHSHPDILPQAHLPWNSHPCSRILCSNNVRTTLSILWIMHSLPGILHDSRVNIPVSSTPVQP